MVLNGIDGLYPASSMLLERRNSFRTSKSVYQRENIRIAPSYQHSVPIFGTTPDASEVTCEPNPHN
jgi:hypothetical protein